ncbi:MAG: TrmH family RNA methyltransferase [Vampirovibrionales bacterium]
MAVDNPLYASPNTLSLPKEPLLAGVVLIEPCMAQNVGTIARLCQCAGVPLYLVGKLGFELHDRGFKKNFKRTAMDYMPPDALQHYPHYEALCQALNRGHRSDNIITDQPAYYLSSKAVKTHWEASYTQETLLVFGSEATGLPEPWVKAHPETSLRIPMHPEGRSLNIAVSVGIVLYEALRQRTLAQGKA